MKDSIPGMAFLFQNYEKRKPVVKNNVQSCGLLTCKKKPPNPDKSLTIRNNGEELPMQLFEVFPKWVSE